MSPQIQVAHVEGAYRCYRTEFGIDRAYFGPRWATPEQAARYSDLAASVPVVSPLRASGALPPIEPVPHAGSVGVGSAPDAGIGVNGPSGGATE